MNTTTEVNPPEFYFCVLSGYIGGQVNYRERTKRVLCPRDMSVLSYGEENPGGVKVVFGERCSVDFLCKFDCELEDLLINIKERKNGLQ